MDEIVAESLAIDQTENRMGLGAQKRLVNTEGVTGDKEKVRKERRRTDKAQVEHSIVSESEESDNLSRAGV